MSARQENRIKWQRALRHGDQMYRGIDKYAPASATAEYTNGVYPLISRRGREIPYQDEPM